MWLGQTGRLVQVPKRSYYYYITVEESTTVRQELAKTEWQEQLERHHNRCLAAEDMPGSNAHWRSQSTTSLLSQGCMPHP
jgi:hypothetical protein